MANPKDTNAKDFSSWFDGLKAEFRKIIWPTQDDIKK